MKKPSKTASLDTVLASLKEKNNGYTQMGHCLFSGGPLHKEVRFMCDAHSPCREVDKDGVVWLYVPSAAEPWLFVGEKT